MTEEWKNWIRRALRSVLGNDAAEMCIGAVEYTLRPDRGLLRGPFNGQRSRQELFQSLVGKLAPAAIIETGTYLGTTTELLAATGVPIFSVESHSRCYGFSKVRFWRRRNVHLLRGDSRAALRMWFDGPLRSARNRSLFVYLDAHWCDDLPLAEELEIVFGACPNELSWLTISKSLLMTATATITTAPANL